MTRPIPTPQLPELLEKIDLGNKLTDLLRVTALPDGDYYHWDQLRHRTPPDGLTHEEWWAGTKLARSQILKPIPLTDPEGEPFKYGLPDPVLRWLHEVDRDASGRIRMAEEVVNPATRDRYIINSLMEESITSSQLEGAATTREVARDMLRSGRRPIDYSEQMVLNNYRAMQFIRERTGELLTPELVFELHRIVTASTLDDETKAGRFRAAGDDIVVEDGLGHVVHVPPPAVQLPKRLDAMCAFANDRSEAPFVHPVVRAIVLHFWVGYDHPFVDGNGRTARALFYWSMLSQGYWLAEYFSISTILRKAPGRYARSFVYTETDDNDVTYFLLHQLRVIRRAIGELEEYLRRKIGEVRRVTSLLRQSTELNHRQLALLSHALRHPGMRYTFRSHRQSHNVVYQTARTDLLELAERGLLVQRRAGKAYVFAAPADLSERLAKAGGEGAGD